MISVFLAATFFHAFLILGESPVKTGQLDFKPDIEAVETLVQIGKYHLNFKFVKGSDLTVLLEAGGGMDSNEWNRIAPALAQKTGATVVSYDRAGFGKSDLPENKHDMKEEIGWLWQGLQKLKLNENLILVGHSFGGWMIRLFASEHSGCCSGNGLCRSLYQ